MGDETVGDETAGDETAGAVIAGVPGKLEFAATAELLCTDGVARATGTGLLPPNARGVPAVDDWDVPDSTPTIAATAAAIVVAATNARR